MIEIKSMMTKVTRILGVKKFDYWVCNYDLQLILGTDLFEKCIFAVKAYWSTSKTI